MANGITSHWANSILTDQIYQKEVLCHTLILLEILLMFPQTSSSTSTKLINVFITPNCDNYRYPNKKWGHLTYQLINIPILSAWKSEAPFDAPGFAFGHALFFVLVGGLLYSKKIGPDQWGWGKRCNEMTWNVCNELLSLYIHMYIYIHINMHIDIYLYIYIEIQYICIGKDTITYHHDCAPVNKCWCIS